MYEIWREQLVTQDGVAPKDSETYGHRADVYAGDGVLELRLSDRNILHVNATEPGEGGPVSIKVTDLRAALYDLERVSPWVPEPSTEAHDIAERAASCVERVCAKLDDNLLVTELRTTMLQLIDRATRPGQPATVAPGKG